MVLDGEGHSFSHYLVRFIYDTTIWTVMARSRRDLGYSRLWLGEDIWWVILARLISTSEPVGGLGWRRTLFFQLFGQSSV
jgi:hypothetical protein